MSTNPLMDFFQNHKGRMIYKWVHYFDIYHKYFNPYRNKKIVVLEFGVWHGGSLQMWKDYFGKDALIYGVDIDPHCKALEEEQIKIFIGDQEDPVFLQKIMAEIGPVDVVIEDGGHTMGQQITTFKEVYPYVKNDGIFLTEDLHTSYWESHGGGLNKKDTFIEYTKKLIDQLSAWHSQDKEQFDVDSFTRSTKAIHFYDSIVVFEKGTIEQPRDEQRGTKSFE